MDASDLQTFVGTSVDAVACIWCSGTVCRCNEVPESEPSSVPQVPARLLVACGAFLDGRRAPADRAEDVWRAAEAEVDLLPQDLRDLFATVAEYVSAETARDPAWPLRSPHPTLTELRHATAAVIVHRVLRTSEGL